MPLRVKERPDTAPSRLRQIDALKTIDAAAGAAIVRISQR